MQPDLLNFFYNTVERDPKEAFAEKEEVFVYTFTPGQRSLFDQTIFQENQTTIDFKRVKFTKNTLSLAPFLSEEARNSLQESGVLKNEEAQNTSGEEKQTENLALSKLFKGYMNTQTGGLLNDIQGFATIFYDIFHDGFIIKSISHEIDSWVWTNINFIRRDRINIHSFVMQSNFLFQSIFINSRKGTRLCLMSECPETGPLGDKLYLGIADSCVKYRTKFTNNGPVTLNGDIGAQDGELYQAIQEEKLAELSEECKNNLFDIILKSGHILEWIPDEKFDTYTKDNPSFDPANEDLSISHFLHTPIRVDFYRTFSLEPSQDYAWPKRMDNFLAQNNESAVELNYELSQLLAWYNNISDSALQSGLFCDLEHQEPLPAGDFIECKATTITFTSHFTRYEFNIVPLIFDDLELRLKRLNFIFKCLNNPQLQLWNKIENKSGIYATLTSELEYPVDLAFQEGYSNYLTTLSQANPETNTTEEFVGKLVPIVEFLHTQTQGKKEKLNRFVQTAHETFSEDIFQIGLRLLNKMDFLKNLNVLAILTKKEKYQTSVDSLLQVKSREEFYHAAYALDSKHLIFGEAKKYLLMISNRLEAQDTFENYLRLVADNILCPLERLKSLTEEIDNLSTYYYMIELASQDKYLCKHLNNLINPIKRNSKNTGEYKQRLENYLDSGTNLNQATSLYTIFRADYKKFRQLERLFDKINSRYTALRCGLESGYINQLDICYQQSDNSIKSFHEKVIASISRPVDPTEILKLFFYHLYTSFFLGEIETGADTEPFLANFTDKINTLPYLSTIQRLITQKDNIKHHQDKLEENLTTIERKDENKDWMIFVETCARLAFLRHWKHLEKTYLENTFEKIKHLLSELPDNFLNTELRASLISVCEKIFALLISVSNITTDGDQTSTDDFITEGYNLFYCHQTSESNRLLYRIWLRLASAMYQTHYNPNQPLRNDSSKHELILLLLSSDQSELSEEFRNNLQQNFTLHADLSTTLLNKLLEHATPEEDLSSELTSRLLINLLFNRSDMRSLLNTNTEPNINDLSTAATYIAGNGFWLKNSANHIVPVLLRAAHVILRDIFTKKIIDDISTMWDSTIETILSIFHYDKNSTLYQAYHDHNENGTLYTLIILYHELTRLQKKTGLNMTAPLQELAKYDNNILNIDWKNGVLLITCKKLPETKLLRNPPQDFPVLFITNTHKKCIQIYPSREDQAMITNECTRNESHLLRQYEEKDEFTCILIGLIQQAIRLSLSCDVYPIPMTLILFKSRSDHYDDPEVLSRATENQLRGFFVLGLMYQTLAECLKNPDNKKGVSFYLSNLDIFFEFLEKSGMVEMLGHWGLENTRILTQPPSRSHPSVATVQNEFKALSNELNEKVYNTWPREPKRPKFVSFYKEKKEQNTEERQKEPSSSTASPHDSDDEELKSSFEHK